MLLFKIVIVIIMIMIIIRLQSLRFELFLKIGVKVVCNSLRSFL